MRPNRWGCGEFCCDSHSIRNALEAKLILLSHKVPALVDYDNFVVAPAGVHRDLGLLALRHTYLFAH